MHVITSPAVAEKIAKREKEKMDKCEKEMEQREKLGKSFHDTYEMSRNDVLLANSVKNSIAGQKIILESSGSFTPCPVSMRGFNGAKAGNVIVSDKRTFEAASMYKGKRTAVLNFASATRPGGGINIVTRTQEECLIRESTLFACISTEECREQFYKPHRDLSCWYNADMIYTPGVTVFKTYDPIPKLMPQSDWFNVDVITMAAPNLSDYTKTSKMACDDELLDTFYTRFFRMMHAAMEHDVDVLILGAFGCGEFGNDPAIVATAAARVLETFRKEFETVEFAIYERRKNTIYRSFRLILDRYTHK